MNQYLFAFGNHSGIDVTIWIRAENEPEAVQKLQSSMENADAEISFKLPGIARDEIRVWVDSAQVTAASIIDRQPDNPQ